MNLETYPDRDLMMLRLADLIAGQLGDFLRREGCDEIQGYWLARPMPAQELEDFVREFGAGSTAR